MKPRWAVGLALLLAVGCAGRSKVAPPRPPGVHEAGEEAERREPARQPLEEAEPTLRLPGQDRVYPSEDPRNRPGAVSGGLRIGGQESAAVSHDSAIVPDPEAEFAPPAVAPGEARYRVQMLASMSRASAMAFRAEMAGILDAPVFIEHEPGIWKVRAGDCSEQSEAESLRRRIVGLGYDDAFVVEILGR